MSTKTRDPGGIRTHTLSLLDVLALFWPGRIEALTSAPCVGCGTTQRHRYAYGVLPNEVACSRKCARAARAPRRGGRR